MLAPKEMRPDFVMLETIFQQFKGEILLSDIKFFQQQSNIEAQIEQNQQECSNSPYLVTSQNVSTSNNYQRKAEIKNQTLNQEKTAKQINQLKQIKIADKDQQSNVSSDNDQESESQLQIDYKRRISERGDNDYELCQALKQKLNISNKKRKIDVSRYLDIQDPDFLNVFNFVQL